MSAFSEPETIVVSVPPDAIRPGPTDDRMYLVDATGKQPYTRASRPPYSGSFNPPVQPGADGHYDHLDPGSREFSCATMYATVRRVLDIWEDYFRRTIDWHFLADLPRLELIPLLDWNNAQSGCGYLEFGYARTRDGGLDLSLPYCQNFDVLAHELGHSLIFSTVGVPRDSNADAVDYNGMQESAGDLVAVLGSLHFDSVLTHLLDNTKGNLFSLNELSRVGELSESRQIRVLFNYLRMGDVSDEPHLRSLPLTGAIFDVLVEVFQKALISRDLISQDLAQRSNHTPAGGLDEAAIQTEFAQAYRGNQQGFREALLSARDYLGELLARTWSTLSPDSLSYHDVLRTLMRADRDLTGSAHEQTIRECFSWRQIRPPADSRLFDVFRLDSCVPEATEPAPLPPSGARKAGASKRSPAKRSPAKRRTAKRSATGKRARKIDGTRK